MTPRFPSLQSLARKTSRFAGKPAKITLGAAAAAAVSAAVLAGVATGSAAAPSSSSVPGAVTALSHVTAPASVPTGVPAADPAGRAGPALGPVLASLPMDGPPTGSTPMDGTADGHAQATSASDAAPARTSRPATSAWPAAAPKAPNHGSQPVRPATAKPAKKPAKAHSQRPAKRPSHHRHARRAGKYYAIYDSVNPTAIPRHRAVATYATGAYAASHRQVVGRRTVLWIDTTGSDYAASILDVEPGDATPTQAAKWAWHRLHRYPNRLARIYTMRSEWGATKAAVARLSPRMRSHIRWWIADPTGHRHIVPGADATQWYWGSNFDITLAKPRF